jgi:hypothetical protein
MAAASFIVAQSDWLPIQMAIRGVLRVLVMMMVSRLVTAPA